jgi:hypothetical protein
LRTDYETICNQMLSLTELVYWKQVLGMPK